MGICASLATTCDEVPLNAHCTLHLPKLIPDFYHVYETIFTPVTEKYVIKMTRKDVVDAGAAETGAADTGADKCDDVAVCAGNGADGSKLVMKLLVLARVLLVLVVASWWRWCWCCLQLC